MAAVGLNRLEIQFYVRCKHMNVDSATLAIATAFIVNGVLNLAGNPILGAAGSWIVAGVVALLAAWAMAKK